MTKSLAKLLLLVLAVAAAVGAADHAFVRTERKLLGDDGVAIEKTYRGETLLMEVIERGNRKTRAFLVDGSVVATESDEDGDGFFERLTVFDSNGEAFECFTRTTNGLVVPMDPAVMEDLKAKKSAADKELRGLLRRERAK